MNSVKRLNTILANGMSERLQAYLLMIEDSQLLPHIHIHKSIDTLYDLVRMIENVE